MNKGKVLRGLLEAKEILIAPGAHDVLTAKIIEKAGFSVPASVAKQLVKLLKPYRSAPPAARASGQNQP